MARAVRASGERNSKATRARSSDVGVGGFDEGVRQMMIVGGDVSREVPAGTDLVFKVGLRAVENLVLAFEPGRR